MSKPNLNKFDPYSNTGVNNDANHASQQPTETSASASASPSPVEVSVLSPLDQSQIQFFLNQGYTVGLLQTLLKEKEKYAVNCWILDNGSKMLVKDSHKVSFDQSCGIIKVDGISRWDELMDYIGNQVWIASNIKMSMRFAVSFLFFGLIFLILI